MSQWKGITKAEIARQLGVSRAYVTMLANGKRKPTREIVNKLDSINVNNLGEISLAGAHGSRTHQGHSTCPTTDLKSARPTGTQPLPLQLV